MHRVPVASSNIRSIGYDASTLTLEVEFKNSAVYIYSGIPTSLHTSLMRAPSKGSFFASHIKDRFTYTQIT